MKKVIGIYSNPGQHWVGDGFPVRSLFSYQTLGQHISPFLLLDYAGPHQFSPATHQRGVGQHPHRGFETVTIVYQGELEHRDSTGSGGRIGPGDVQWMTAASGILHEEFHSADFARQGGTLEMVQLWVNLPAAKKLAPPNYQTLLNADIPTLPLPEGAGNLRLIAGEYSGKHGPAQTFTAMDVWDIRLRPAIPTSLRLHEGRNSALVILRGAIQVNGEDLAREGELVLLERSGDEVLLEANSDAVVLLLSGEPIDEPVVNYGPFVMNTEVEIQQAIEDLRNGQFGQIHD
ncbi:pirin family protein [Pseudomonas sp.]|uniref:pirin family protein n=1 Tax=Pseudomonas sp. TaxID=306 RepID=UPI003A987392